MCRDNHWVFWAGPMSGALISALVYELTFRPSHDPVSILSELSHLGICGPAILDVAWLPTSSMAAALYRRATFGAMLALLARLLCAWT